MAKSVTYNDLEGTAPVVSAHGIEFEDGKAVEVEDDEIASKLDGNAFFMVEGSTEKKVGRPRKAVEFPVRVPAMEQKEEQKEAVSEHPLLPAKD
jgi:hypothetical protein